MTSTRKITVEKTAVVKIALSTAAATVFAMPVHAQQVEETDQILEVVVTATRQVSTVNRVPMSITAVTAEMLEIQRIQDVQDLVRIVPGVSFNRDTHDGRPDITIRGIKSVQGPTTTGIYLDDVPIHKRGVPGGISGNGSPFPQLHDLERVEVLRGPQGTLYGGSAAGGAVRFITPTPSLAIFDASANAEISQVHQGDVGYEAAFAVGGPLIEGKLGVRASAIHRRQGGYMDHVSLYTGEEFGSNTNWRETSSGRLAMAWAPTENLKITPSLYYSRELLADHDLFFDNIPQFTTNCGVFTNRGTTPGGVTGGVQYDFPDREFTDCGTYGPYNFFGPGKTFMGIYPTMTGTPQMVASPRDTRLFVPSLTIDYDFGGVTLKSITGYVEDTVKGSSPGIAQMLGTFPAIMPNNTNAQFVIPGSVAATCGSVSSVTDDGVCRVPVPGGVGTNFIIPGYPQRLASSQFNNGRKAFTQELRLQSGLESEKLSWVAGLFYSNSDYVTKYDTVGDDQDVAMFLRGVGMEWFLGAPAANPETGQLMQVGESGLVLYRRQYTTDTEYAVFGEINYNFTARLKATLGVRLSQAEVDYNQYAAGPNGVGNPDGFVATPQPPARITDPNEGHPFANQPGDPSFLTAGAQKERPVTPKIGLAYQANGGNLFYGVVSTGYRVGGINIPTSQGQCGPTLTALGWTGTPLEYNSDKLTSYELGAKNRIGAWQVNTSVFYIDWKNPQVTQRLSQCAFNYVANAGAAISQGFDVQVAGRLGPVSLTGSAAYTDAHYTETVQSTVSTGTPQIMFREGDMLGVPKWQVSASAHYDFSFISRPAYLRASYQYSGGYLRTTGPGTVTYDPIGYEADAVQNVDARLGVNLNQLDVALFVDNLTNEDSLLTQFRPGGSFLTYMAIPRPREVGLAISYRF